MARRIRVSSSALGPRLYVLVLVYDELEELRAAATRYNGDDHRTAVGTTQVRRDEDHRAVSVLVRLARGYLTTDVVVHEMHHASTALYGAHVGDRITRRAHLNHVNEPFAHLHSDLTYRLVDALHANGYYRPAPPG